MFYLGRALALLNYEVPSQELCKLHKKPSFTVKISLINVIRSHLLKRSLMKNFSFCAVVRQFKSTFFV